MKTSAETRRRKRIIDAYGKFQNTKTSSNSFALKKEAEIKREERRRK